MTRAAKRQRVAAGPAAVSITDCSIYLAPGLQPTLDEFDTIMARAKLTTASVREVSVFIVRDVAEPPAAVLWNAALVGGKICTWARVKTGNSGPVRVFKAALDSRRLLYMTDSFLAECPRLASTLVDRSTAFGRRSKWRFTNDMQYFATRAGREPTVCIALRSSIEGAEAVGPGIRQVFTSGEALEFFLRQDPDASAMGMRGR